MARLRVLAVVAAAMALLGAPVLTVGQGQGPGGPGQGVGGGRGGGETGYGNNLSVPVVFAEGHGLLGLPTTEDTGLRPRPEDPAPNVLTWWDPTSVVIKDGTLYYPQQSGSHWQAAWRNGGAGGEAAIVNWSDNLTKQRWTARSMIRVETVLYQDDAANLLLAYGMGYLFGSGASEMYGATTATYDSAYRTVYSVCARLRIEKLVGPGGPVDTSVPGFEEPVYGSFGQDGPGGYTAEVNVSGNLIYGYNWALSQWPIETDQKVGWWRLTFSLDPTATYTIAPEGEVPQSFTVARNTTLASLDPGDLESTVLFTPTIDTANAISVLEIEVLAKRTGRKPDNPGKGPKNQ